MQDFRDSAVSREILAYHCPRYSEFPNVELYMDQVLTILEEALRPFAINDKEKLITSTMVNNYVKQGVVLPPQKKRYSRQHLAYLMTVCVLKQVLPLSDICRLVKLQISVCPLEQAYDYFCEALEAALENVFLHSGAGGMRPGGLPEAELVYSGTLAFANKIYLQKYLQFRGQTHSLSRPPKQKPTASNTISWDEITSARTGREAQK